MSRKPALPVARLLLWLALAAPAVWIVWRYASDAVTYGEVIHFTGDLSVQLLIVTLAATPLRLAFPRGPLPLLLVRWRRNLGVACFAYAALHIAVYLLRKADPALILREGAEWGLLTGWLAFGLFLPLALTSNDAAVRALGRAWKPLHRLVYAAAVLALAHWLLTAFDLTVGLIHAAVLAALEAARVLLTLKRRRPSAR